MTHPNVFRALGILSDYLEKHGDRVATAANADDVLNAFDAMRSNLREEAYRTVLENKQRLFNALREVNTSFGLSINSMAALGQDTTLYQKLQRTVIKITSDISFMGEDDADNDGIRDSAVTQGEDGKPSLDLDLDAASKQADELFAGLSGDKPQAANTPAMTAEDAAGQGNDGGFADDIDEGDDAANAEPGTGGMADDFDDKQSLQQAYDAASAPKAEDAGADAAPADGEGGDDPFGDVPSGEETGSPFDGTSNEGGSTAPGSGEQVANNDAGNSDEDIDKLFAEEFPSKPAAPAQQQPAQQPAPVAQSSVKIATYDGMTHIKKTPLLMATAADGQIAFYAPVTSYLEGSSEAVAGSLSSIGQVKGPTASTRTFSRLLSEGKLREIYRPS